MTETTSISSGSGSTTTRILIINPNTSTAMTTALAPVVESLNFHGVSFTFFTSPATSPSDTSLTGVPSINSPADAARSAAVCLPALLPLLPAHDAFLVACYSQHPLVHQLQRECNRIPGGRRRHVTGIFEASVAASLSLLAAASADDDGDVCPAFGIVSTGAVWKPALQDAVQALLGGGAGARFVGCETTGLNADELHRLPAEEVRAKMMQATRRLVAEGRERGLAVRAVCLGCAGMVGLEQAVAEAVAAELGDEEARLVSVVDGVRVGTGLLVALAKAVA